MKFAELTKYKNDKVISARHEKWLASNSNPVYSYKALEFGNRALVDMGRPRDRKGTISASSFNSCWRRQQFTFIGLPEIPPATRLAQIFQTGTFMHIRWQMAGLTEGWLKEAEVPVPPNAYGLSGTQDGVAYDDTIVELKSIHNAGFANVMAFGPKADHVAQVNTYLLTTEAEQATLIYENKDTQEWTEVVQKRDEDVLDELGDNAEKMWNSIESKQLFDVLDKCWDHQGRYRGCPFRDQCLGVKSWQEAEELANS